MTHINTRKLENYGMTQGFNLDSSTSNMKNDKHDKIDIPPNKRAKQGGTGIQIRIEMIHTDKEKTQKYNLYTYNTNTI